MATANMPPGAVPTNGMADPFASSPTSPANTAPFRYAAFDNDQFSLAATHSPSSARRALEAHLKNTDRRIHEASRLGTTLIQQRKDLAAKLKEVEQMQTESEVPEDLRQKLSELEREYHEVGKESARAFLPKSRVVSEANDTSAGSGIISGSGRDSPTKAQAPSMSRRQRNQPAHRVHDIEFATEISTSLIAQVRQLQAALTEKDDELKDITAAKALLEAEAAHLVQKLRHFDENEQKYKDENWNLETRLQDMEASLRESMDKEGRLVQTLKSIQAEKATKERELDDLKVSHEKLNEDHAMAKKVQEADMHGLKRDAAVHENEKSKLERRIAELVAQNTELARAVSYRMNLSAQQSETDFVSAEEGIQSDEQSPLDSAPPSPIKGTPARHGMLEQETLKSSLNHAHRMIQNLKNTIHREKTEKIELKRMLQDARDELETRRESTGIVGANMAKKRRSEPEGVKFKRPSASRLGATRTSTTEILEDEPDWEDHEADQTPSKPRSVGVATGAATLGAAGMAGYDHAYGRSEDDSTNAFDTAHERDTTTESEAFATGKEDFGEDTDGDLTETEGNTNNTLRSVGSFTSRPKVEHRQSYMSTASMSGDDDDDVVRTPIQNAQQPKYKLRLSRGVRRSGRVSDIIADSPNAASNSPASSNGTPQRAQQTLGDELDALNEDSMEGTPSSSFMMDDEGSPITQRELSMEPGAPTKSEHESVAMISNEDLVRKPDMVDSAMMTEPWEPERVIEERVIEKEVRVEVSDHKQSLKDHASDVTDGALAGLGVGRFMGAHHENAREMDDAGQSTAEAFHEDLTRVPPARNEIDFPLSQSRADEAGSYANETGLKGLMHSDNHTQEYLPAVAHARNDEIAKYKAQIAEVNRSHEDQIEKHKSELQQAQQAREAEIEKIKSAVKQEQISRDAEVQEVTSQMQQLQVSLVAQVERAGAEIKQLQNARAADVEMYRTELAQANQFRESEQQSYKKEVEALKQQGVEASQTMAQLKLDHIRQLQHFKGLVNEISGKLTVAEQERDDLQQYHGNIASQFHDLSRQHAQVQSLHAQTELEKEQLKQEHFNSNTQFEHLKRQFMELQSKHAQAQETIRSMTPEPVNFTFSDLLAQDVKPVEIDLPEEPDFPSAPRRSSKRPEHMLGEFRGQHESNTLLTENNHDHPLIATDGDEENVHNESPVDTAFFPRPPLAEESVNTPPSRPPPSIPTADEGSQTLVSGKDIDTLLRNKTAVVAGAPPSRDVDNSLPRNAAVNGAAAAAAVGAMTPATTPPSRDRSVEVRPSIYESPTLRQPRRPSSSGSMRATGAAGAPPLPADHTKKIAEAQRAPGTPTGQTSIGTMGPPAMPASAYKRTSTRDRSTNERVGSRDSTTPRPVQTRASRSQMASDRVSHRTSVSSFASELDERFNITRGHGVYPDDITPPTDPRMIQAITQTMIGEYLWKYTRKAGRSETSNTRHRRFFWVHPYTRTLYWSEQDPSTAGKNMLKAKSVAIDSVRVITDDNAYPPGLHRKSLVVVTPGREIVFTAPTAQRHETWFNALSYLLLRTDKEKGEAEDTFDESDLDEFRPGFGRSVRRSISKMTGQQRSSSRQSRDRASLSSYNSRTTRNTSPQRQDADRTITNRHAAATQQSKSLQPPTSNSGLTSTVSNNSRQSSGSVGGRFTSLTSRFRPSSSGRSGSALSNRRDNLDPASIYDASVVANSAEDLRAVIEQQEKQADRLEDVRACCDGRHNVGSLSRANGRHSNGHQSHSHRH
ncbi:hypothetical protein DOTSEDRAFT_71096 [Dothistroma septosporum NZE10]|uniref:PH domain-containing protein n=1 Tax=Dothistroma septosporum (strain NZE10 / CBS 128990) TaxID=675120 RepID=N1PS74_DOTSN|nr:hypothetical protein DOTSEDRAFT_71096 [Dothistroma septosporum NZE10]